jgi:hypothetical protein
MYKGCLFILFALLLGGGIAFAIDSDGDGLSDTMEASLGSSPLHKDIFVEIDWFIVNGRNLKPRPGFVQFVQAIFNAAPVYNPDGFTGIRIHIELSQGIRTTRTVLGYKNSNGSYNWNDFDSYKSAYFTPSRRNTHHYCLFVQDYGDENGGPTGSSGISRNGPNFGAGASDLIVSLGGKGWFNKPNGGVYKYTQAGTFVHELGHNLGLRHGGTDHTQYKPNLLSLMNYSFQTDGIPYTRSDGVQFRIFDYSRSILPLLNENNLNEARGLGPFASDLFGVYGTTFFVFDGQEFVQYDTFDATSFVDWNQDGTINTSVKMNINQDVVQQGNSVFHKYSTLRSIEQWSKLVYTGGWVGVSGLSSASALPSETSLRCLHYNDLPKRKISSAASNVRYGTYMDVFKK